MLLNTCISALRHRFRFDLQPCSAARRPSANHQPPWLARLPPWPPSLPGGIPYAEPPVAGLRFRPPQPKTAWGPGRLMADRFGASCMQMGSPQVPGRRHTCLAGTFAVLCLWNCAGDCAVTVL